ncbi:MULTISPECIES: hypothetical protein [unclassified Moorena]|uniref:hypothetical protein n=1 Tax=unclassified Moorena TaxID=2683338 RepID=UPI0013C587D7|nr:MULTISPECIES: hypothetical protein [unclassified Moorena]NEO23233.1 hypothetical protein [Moorena sp. SIO4A5]NEP24561.1 hypothetical protein [Moorena sp. SIO3I6]NEQ60472.1 hypothetical protein [Moorena sp. SIO4A1]
MRDSQCLDAVGQRVKPSAQSCISTPCYEVSAPINPPQKHLKQLRNAISDILPRHLMI